MVKNLILMGFVVVSCSFLSLAQNINSEKSRIEFKVTNLGAKKVKGNFTGMRGSIKFDPKSFANGSFDVCIDASSINTNLKKRDEKLKGVDYFDVNNYPDICFTSTKIERSGMNYKTTGLLKMHGESKVVEIIFNYSRNSFTGKLKVNRLDFNIGPKSGILVGREVEITILCFVD